MRRTILTLAGVLSLMLCGSAASAKSWHGITPGKSTQRDVVKKFGSPDHEEGPAPGYHKRVVYTGKTLGENRGAAEAQFWFDKTGRLSAIYVLPAVELTRKDVEGAWGKDFNERRTDDFRLYLHYATEGFAVFFDRGTDRVYQLIYTIPIKRDPDATAKKPTAEATPRVNKLTRKPNKLTRKLTPKPSPASAK